MNKGGGKTLEKTMVAGLDGRQKTIKFHFRAKIFREKTSHPEAIFCLLLTLQPRKQLMSCTAPARNASYCQMQRMRSCCAHKLMASGLIQPARIELATFSVLG